MKKKLMFLFIFMACFFNIQNVYAIRGTYIQGKIIINWIDYQNIDNKRPTSITIKLDDSGEQQSGIAPANRVTEQLVELNVNDATVEVDPNDSNITRWVFENYKSASGISYLFNQDTTTSLPAFRYMGESVNGVPGVSSYTYIKDEGAIIPDDRFGVFGGTQDTMTITYALDTYIPMKLKVNYNDDNGRDNVRNLKLAVKGTNLGVTSRDDLIRKNAYEEFNVGSNKTLTRKVDNYTKTFYLSRYNDSRQNIIYALEDISGIINTKYSLDLDVSDNEAIATLNYSAEKINIPVKVIWKDDNNRNNKRPHNITLKAYDQNDHFEKEIVLSEDDNWNVLAEVFKNMIYSGGVGIDYTLKIDNDQNYEYQIIGDNNGFTIEAKLIKNDTNENSEIDKTIDHNKQETGLKEVPDTGLKEVPDTGDNIIIYILTLVLSLVLSLGTFILRKKIC